MELCTWVFSILPAHMETPQNEGLIISLNEMNWGDDTLSPLDTEPGHYQQANETFGYTSKPSFTQGRSQLSYNC